MRNRVHVWGRLFACMRSWVHVQGTVVCIYAELGACLRSWVHVWGTVLGWLAELAAFLGAGCFPKPPSWPRPQAPGPPTHHPGSSQAEPRTHRGGQRPTYGQQGINYNIYQ